MKLLSAKYSMICLGCMKNYQKILPTVYMRPEIIINAAVARLSPITIMITVPAISTIIFS